MNPVEFPEANCTFGPPQGLTENQVRPIKAYRGTVPTGSIEGLPMVVTAWKPNDQEKERILNGEPIYLTIIGTLPPHSLTTSFTEATNLA